MTVNLLVVYRPKTGLYASLAFTEANQFYHECKAYFTPHTSSDCPKHLSLNVNFDQEPECTQVV